MNINKIIVYITVVACMLLIFIPTLYKVIYTNHNNLNTVTEKLIIESAYKCYYADKCKNSIITLKDLYDNNYLEKDIINPVTKEVYPETSYVVITKDNATFNEG